MLSQIQRLFLIVCLLGLVTCADDQTQVLVHLNGLPVSVSSLRFSSALNNVRAEEVYTKDSGDITQVTLRFAPMVSGRLQVHIEGLDTHGCVSARGDGLLTLIPSARAEISISLQVLSKPLCDCSADNWCWDGNRQENTVIWKLWSHPSTNGKDVWAIGSGGTILRWTGNAWNPVTSGTTSDLRGIWGSAPDSIWVVGGNGTILYWNGTIWTKRRSPTTSTIADVWGGAANDVWAIANGDAGLILRKIDSNGPEWLIVNSFENFNTSISGSSPNDIWVVGPSASHWDGKQWTSLGVGFFANSVQSASLNNAYAVNANGDYWQLKFDPANSTTPISVTLGAQVGVAVQSSWQSGSIGWAVGNDQNGHGLVLRNSGSGWSPVNLPIMVGSLTAILVNSPSDVWVSGTGNIIMHYDGTNWNVRQAPTISGENTLIAIHGNSPDNLWTVGSNGLILHWNGNLWKSVSSGTDKNLFGVQIDNDNNTWVSGSNGSILKIQSEIAVPYNKLTNNNINKIWKFDNGDMWAVGDKGTILQFTNGSWKVDSTSPSQERLAGIWGSSNSDIWAIGPYSPVASKSTILHRVNNAWSTVTHSLSFSLNPGIWGTSYDNVWVACEVGIAHYDGNVWSQIMDPLPFDILYGLHGASDRDIWAVGNYGKILHNTGSSKWQSEVNITTNTLLAVWALDPFNIVIVGGAGTILRKRL